MSGSETAKKENFNTPEVAHIDNALGNMLLSRSESNPNP